MKYIIFDLDGTLSRTDKFMIPSIELAMEKMNIPALDRRCYSLHDR